MTDIRRPGSPTSFIPSLVSADGVKLSGTVI